MKNLKNHSVFNAAPTHNYGPGPSNSQMWRTDQYGRKGIIAFLFIFVRINSFIVFLWTFFENDDKFAFYTWSDSIA